MPISLEQLLADAKRHAIKKPLVDKEKLEPSTLYTSPVNWLPGSLVALVHRETNTALGTFRDWRHISDPSARKLVVEAGPTSKVEYVEGEQWLPAEAEDEATSLTGLTFKDVMVGIARLTNGGCAELCPMRVRVWPGGLFDRAILTMQTSFHSPNEVLILPAGVNILPMLDHETKVAIAEELKDS